LGNPIVTRPARHMRWPRVNQAPWLGNRRILWTPWLRFLRDFFSVVG
jgi:hypothetical protein